VLQVNPSAAQIETVLDLIYDAAAENGLWRDVLTAIADLTNSQGGILFGQSFTAQRIYFDFNGRLDEECNRAYQERHMQNPWSEYMEHQPVGRLVLSDEAIELSKLRKTGFYHDVLRPQNIAHNGMMALASRRDFRAAFNLCRGARQGQFAPEEQRLLEWLSPHLRRSVALGFRIDGYIAMQQAAFNILEHLAARKSCSPMPRSDGWKRKAHYACASRSRPPRRSIRSGSRNCCGPPSWAPPAAP
jgi:hypothetical protein